MESVSRSRQLCGQAARLACVLGVFASTTSSGGLSLPLIVEGAIVLGWILVGQALAVGVVLKMLGARGSRTELVIAYWSSHSAWVLLLIGLSAVAVCSPDHQVFRGIVFSRGVLPLALSIAWLWSTWSKSRLFRRRLRLSPRRTLLAMLLLNLIFLLSPFAYFIGTRQLPLRVLLGYL